MPSKIIWPYTDDELIDGVHKAGGVKQFADAHKASDNSLWRELERRGIRERARVTDTKVPSVAIDDPVRLREQRDKAIIATLRRENNDYAKALSTQEELFKRVVEATRVPVAKPRFKVRKASGSKPERSVVIPVYDQQYGQLVRPDDTPGGKGHYNAKVYDARLARWLEGATGNIRHYAQTYAIEEAIFVLGGDHVEGDDIFAGQPWQLEFDPCRQVWSLTQKMAEAMEAFIRFLKEEIGVKHIAIYGVDDNHGKVGGKRKGATPSTYSWNWLFQMMLKDKLSHLPIDEYVIDPAGAIFFYAAGLEFQAIHGHHIRGWGGIPYYGIQRYDAKSVRLHSRVFRYLLMGHIHQPAEITVGTGAEAIVSGDWVGANNLSGAIVASSRPQQKVLYVAEKWGVTETARIYLTDAEEAFDPTHIYGRMPAPTIT